MKVEGVVPNKVDWESCAKTWHRDVEKAEARVAELEGALRPILERLQRKGQGYVVTGTISPVFVDAARIALLRSSDSVSGAEKTLGTAVPEREPEIPKQTGASVGDVQKPSERVGARSNQAAPLRPSSAEVTESLSGSPNRSEEGAQGHVTCSRCHNLKGLPGCLLAPCPCTCHLIERAPRPSEARPCVAIDGCTDDPAGEYALCPVHLHALIDAAKAPRTDYAWKNPEGTAPCSACKQDFSDVPRALFPSGRVACLDGHGCLARQGARSSPLARDRSQWTVWGADDEWWASGPYRKTSEEAECDLPRSETASPEEVMRIARKVQRETIEACVQRLQGFHFTDGQPAIHPKALEALRAMVTGGTE